MKSIISRTNPLIKQLALLKQQKYRLAYGQFCAEGERVCTTLSKSGLTPLCIVVVENMVSNAKQLISEDKIIVVPPSVMEKISTSKNPSGIVGQYPIPLPPDPQTLSNGIVLAQIADPGNMGTLIRTAAALNISSIVVIQGADPWSPKVIQASAGTIGIVSLFQLTWQELLKYKKKYNLYALTVRDGKNPFTLSARNALLVVGSEAHGIPSEWVSQCDDTLTLPMAGNIESLNAAIAGSIALYITYQSKF